MNLPILLAGLTTQSSSEKSFYEDALCAQTHPEAFFPQKGHSSKAAKAMCARCEVITECLQLAIDNDEEFGVWGGLSARERRNLVAGVVDESLLARLAEIRLPAVAEDSEPRRLAG